MEACIRPAATRLILRLLYGYSNLLGITAIRIDLTRKKMIKSRALSFYVACINVAFVVSIPFAIYRSFVSMDNLSSNSLLRLINKASMLTYLISGVFMIVLRRRRDYSSELLAQQFFALDVRYFNKLPRMETIEQHFEYMLLAKAFTMFGQMASSFFGILQLAHVVDLWLLLRAAYSVSTKYMLQGIVFQSYVELAHARKCFEMLNIQLYKLQQGLQLMHAAGGYVDTLQQLYRLTTEELEQISKAHWQLVCLVQRLCRNYTLQTLGMLFTNAIYTIAYGYISIIVTDGSLNLKPSKLALAFGTFCYVSLLIDLYLFYRNCDLTVEAYKHTAYLLKQATSMPYQCEEMERCSELFSGKMAQRKLHISLGGIFDLNLQSLLALWAFILKHTIILVQSELENRLHK